MKFSVGYQLPDEYDSMVELVQDYRDHLSSVYYAAPGRASARSVLDPESASVMKEELSFIHGLGIRLVMLYNANCYGADAASPKFRSQILEDVEYAAENLGLQELTTTSPFVAKTVKKAFPEIQVIASVNMWIGTKQAMEYLGDSFDGYYLQREYNRDFRKIRCLKAWCDQHGKKLRILANSGCLYACPYHTFHDNMVAHEVQLCGEENKAERYPSPCWEMMDRLDAERAAAVFLQENWIRPQDVAFYEPYFQEMKLATRMHTSPRRVLHAYVCGKHNGNLLDLTEPGFSQCFDRHILDATLFPKDWFERTTNCSRDCERCGYCYRTAQKMLVEKRALERQYLSAGV